MTSGAAATVDLDEQARSLAAKAKLVANRATEDELAWLIWSAGTLRGSIKFMAAGNWLGVKQAQKLLLQAGWAGVLARVGGRLNIPLESKNLRPFDKDRLRAGARRLLAAMHHEIAKS